MIEAGIGVAFLPDMSTAEDVGANGKPGRLWRSAVEPTLSLPLHIVTWREGNPSVAVDAFVEEVRRIGVEWDGTEMLPETPPAPRARKAAPKVAARK